MPCLKICTWPGQFIGLIAYTRSSGVRVVYMFSPNCSQCPDASHRLRSMSSGRVDLLEAGRLLAFAHVADQRLEHAASPWDARTPRPAPPPACGTGRARGRCGGDRAFRPPRVGAGSPRAASGPARPCRRSAAASRCANRRANRRPATFISLKALQLAGRGHVRTAAQIHPIALAVEADRLARRDRCDDLGLVVLAEARGRTAPPHRAAARGA